MYSYRRPDPSSAPTREKARKRDSNDFRFGAAARRGARTGLGRCALSGLLVMLGVAACSDDGNETPTEPTATETKTDDKPADTKDASVTTPTKVEADDYCKHLCDRGKACDEAYDRQTCVRECESESGVIGNLNPALLEGLYECVDKTSCSTIEAERFVAECLADAADEVDPNTAGKALCTELETAADECSFTDFDERACWQVSSAYSDEVLESAAICARKKCELIVDCLDATLKVPSELDETPIGFDDGELSSESSARPATESFLPETSTVVVSPDTGPTTKPRDTTPDETVPPDTDQVRTEPSETTDAPLTTPTLPTLPINTEPTPPGIDITDPDVQAEYCADENDCDDCRFKACCLETLTCLTNSDCIGWIDCVSGCPADAYACTDACRQTFAAGEIAAIDYVNCFSTAGDEVCAPQCSESSTDTSGGSSSVPPATSSSYTTTSETEGPTFGTGSQPSDSTSSEAVSSDPTSTAIPPESTDADAGADACSECLATLCDAELDSCMADDICYYLYAAYVYCWDGATSEQFVECFNPRYSYWAQYEPESVSLFDDMIYCVGYAECAECSE